MPHYHRKENRIETNTMPAAESVCVRKSYIKMNIPPNYLNPDTYLYGELNVITAETYMYMRLDTNFTKIFQFQKYLLSVTF